MEDKRYDPYTGYEIKDEDPTQEYHTQDDDPYRRYRYEDDHIEQPQQEQTSGIAIATMILGIIAVVCMVSCCCTPIAIIIGIEHHRPRYGRKLPHRLNRNGLRSLPFPSIA